MLCWRHILGSWRKQHNSSLLLLCTQCLYWRTWNMPTSSHCTTSSTPTAASLWCLSILWVHRQFNMQVFKRCWPELRAWNMDSFKCEHCGCCVFQDSDLKQYLDNCGNLMSMHNVKVSQQQHQMSNTTDCIPDRERDFCWFTSVQGHKIWVLISNSPQVPWHHTNTASACEAGCSQAKEQIIKWKYFYGILHGRFKERH